MLDERLEKQSLEVKAAVERLDEALADYTFARESHERALMREDATKKHFRVARRIAAKASCRLEAEKARRKRIAYEISERLEKRKSRIRDLSQQSAELVAMRNRMKKPWQKNAAHAASNSEIYFWDGPTIQSRIDELAWEIDYLRECNAQDQATLFIKLFSRERLDALKANFDRAMAFRIEAWMAYQSAKADAEVLEQARNRASDMYDRRAKALESIRRLFFERMKTLREEKIANKDQRKAAAIQAVNLEGVDVKVVFCANGKMQIYYGGEGRPDGSGHGHVSFYADGTIEYRRTPRKAE